MKLRMQRASFLIFICFLFKLQSTGAADQNECPQLVNEKYCKSDPGVKSLCYKSCSLLLDSIAHSSSTSKPDHAKCPYLVNTVTCNYTKWVKPLCPSACEAIVLNSTDAPTRFTTDHRNCHLFAKQSTCKTRFKVQLLCPLSCEQMLDDYPASTPVATVPTTQPQGKGLITAATEHELCRNYKLNPKICSFLDVKQHCSTTCAQYAPPELPMTTLLPGYADAPFCHLIANTKTCQQPDVIKDCKIACAKYKITTPTTSVVTPLTSKPASTTVKPPVVTITTSETQSTVATTSLEQTSTAITESWTTEKTQTSSVVPTETQTTVAVSLPAFTTPEQSCPEVPRVTKLCPSAPRDFNCFVNEVSPTISANGTNTMDICFKCTGVMNKRSCQFCSWLSGGPACFGQAREDMKLACEKKCKGCNPSVVQFAWAKYPCLQVFQTIVEHHGTAAAIPFSILAKIFDPAFRDQVCNIPATGDWRTQISLP